ncbi:cell wall-binding repeat-containing protein [Clostridium senegalense]
MKKSSRVVSTLLLGATVASASTGVFAVESKEIIKEKLAGETRFETAVEVSNKFGKADTVVLVNYTGIADALAATPLAKMKNAPILLTEAGSLTKATADQIAKLEAKKVIVIGGETAVSKNVVKQLEELKLDVERVAGEDRYATSEAVANEMGKDGKVEKVAVVNGIKGLADALSVAAPAAKEGMAIVLSDGTSVRAGQKVLDEAKTKYVIGGETVVSKELTEKLGAERLAGANRNATNAEVLNKFYDAKELDKVYVAKDGAAKENQLVDALAAGPLAGKEGNPLVLAGSELDKAQEAYLKDRIAKSLVEVGEGINQNTVSAIVKALTVKEETPSDKAEVTGVEVLNASQIEVKFSQKVDKDSAEDLGNYEIKEDGKSVDLLYAENYKPIEEKATNSNKVKNGIARVQEDGKTVILTLPQAYLKQDAKFFNQETIRVKVQDIMNENKSEVFEKYENKKIKLFDNTLPELKEIKQVGPADFDLVFSEPITAENASTIVSATRIDNGKYSFTAETRCDNEVIGSNVVRLSTSTDVADGEHTLTIKENKIMDYAGLKLEAVEKKFEAKESKEDFTASVYKTKNNEDNKGVVTIDFNKEVDEDTAIYAENKNVKYYLDYENEKGGYFAKTAEMKDGKLELTFDNEIPSGDHKILVRYDKDNKDKVTDLWGNELATKDINFTVAKDTIAPKATVTYNKDDKKIEVKFSKKVNKDEAKKGSNYQLKDEQGNYKAVGTLDQKDSNSLIYRIDAKDLSGKYTLTIKGNKIHDTSVEKNAVEECSFELDTLDSKAPSVMSVGFGGDEKDNNKIYVEYSEAMKTEGEGSILDKSLYHLDYTQDVKNDADKHVDKTLDEIEDAKIDPVGDNAVIITVPDKIVGDAIKVKIGRVCDANGNFVAIGGFVGNSVLRPDGIKEEDINNDKVLGTTFTAQKDDKVELIKGSQVDDDDILDGKDVNINIVDSEKVEIYVKGHVTSAVADLIDIDGNKCKEAKTELVTLKVDEGQYVKATKLTLEFESEVKKGDSKKLNLDDGSITTVLDTKLTKQSLPLTFGDKSEKKVVKYVDDTASIIVDNQNKAQRVEFELNTPVHNVNVDTFNVGDKDYTVKSVEYAKDGKIVILNLDGKSVCEAADGDADIDVELNQPIYDLNDNKTDEMDTIQIERVIKLADIDSVNKGEVADVVKALDNMKMFEEKTTADQKIAIATKVKEARPKNEKDEVVGFKSKIEIEEAVAKAIKDIEAEAKEQAIKDAEKKLEDAKADLGKKSQAVTDAKADLVIKSQAVTDAKADLVIKSQAVTDAKEALDNETVEANKPALQEAVTKAEEAETAAKEVVTKAEEAETVAKEAVTKAEEAETVAKEAVTKAEEALEALKK